MTPIQELIKEIEFQIQKRVGEGAVSGGWIRNTVLLNILKSKLPEERNVIEQAYIAGKKAAYDSYTEPTILTSTQYYTSKFKGTEDE